MKRTTLKTRLWALAATLLLLVSLLAMPTSAENVAPTTNLETTFDSNPWLLNKDAYEIDEYISNKQSKGLSLEEIIDNIDSGMMEE